MAKKLLNQKEQWYADTIDEAKEIVTAAEESDALISHKISTKHNKYGEYQLVDINYQHATPKEFMENGDGKKSDAPDGQLSIDEVHEGKPYTVNGDGTVEVLPDGDNPPQGDEVGEDE